MKKPPWAIKWAKMDLKRKITLTISKLWLNITEDIINSIWTRDHRETNVNKYTTKINSLKKDYYYPELLLYFSFS